MEKYKAKLENELTAQKQKAQKDALEQEAINAKILSGIEDIKTNSFIKKSQAENRADYRKVRNEKIKNTTQEQSHKSRINHILNWFKVIILALLLMILIAASIIGLYRFYRWATEEPLIKEIEKKVEIEKIVEKEIEVEKIIEKEVIPEECTQIRRNGQIFVSCDGVTIDGAPTISESGIQEIPDLVTD